MSDDDDELPPCMGYCVAPHPHEGVCSEESNPEWDYEWAKKKVRFLWEGAAKAEIDLCRARGMKPCGPPDDREGWWYLPDETDDGRAYKRDEACRLILAGIKIIS